MTQSSSGRASIRTSGEDSQWAAGIITGPNTVTFPAVPRQLAEQIHAGYVLLVSDDGSSVEQAEIASAQADGLEGSDQLALSVTLTSSVDAQAAAALPRITLEQLLRSLTANGGDVAGALAELGIVASGEPLDEPADVEVRTLAGPVSLIFHPGIEPLGFDYCDISPLCFAPDEPPDPES